MNLPVYMDYHATTPCDQRVLEAMLPYFTQQFGNSSSHGHYFGWQAAEAVKMAREQVAALIHADPSEIVFTSGATESINLALKGIFELYSGKGKHIITVSTEHSAVLDSMRHLEKLGAEITYLPVLNDGLLDPDLLVGAIRPDTILVSVMFANNETGVLQPLETLSRIAKEKGIIFFTDATQAVGKVPVFVDDFGVDLLACSAHKIYGPKGVGALYIRRKNPRVRLTAQQDGGGQEKGFRSGTLNVPGIVGFGKAASLASLEMERNMLSIGYMRDRLEASLLELDGVFLNGNRNKRLYSVSNLTFSEGRGKQVLATLQKSVAVSSGSACHSASPEPSHVLKAMGMSDEAAFDAVRFSLGRFSTDDEVEYVIEQVRNSLNGIQELAEPGN